MAVELKPFSWQRMIDAVEAVRERALRATAALKVAQIPYAVAGGNAVAAWVARVDRAAVRNTRDVDILVRRSDFDRVKLALEAVGFIHHELMGVDCFIDGPDGSPRDGVHLLYAAEKVRPEYVVASADVTEIESADDYDVVRRAIGHIREKLGDAGEYVETVRGVGYRWRNAPSSAGASDA